MFLEILDNPQTVENKGESNHYLENLEILEILEIHSSIEKPSGNAEGSRNPWVIKFHGRLGC